MSDGEFSEVTDDALLGGQVRLRQPKDGFRAAIDTVLLAAAVPAAPGDRILELGAGCGGVALCLARRVDGIRVTGIEIQPSLVRLAGENARANGLDGVVEIMRGDIAGRLPPRVQGPFDRVMFNPPFHDESRVRPPDNPSRAVANVEGIADLADWVATAYPLLRTKGTLTMINRADRLDDIVEALRGRFGGLMIFPLWPKAGRAAKRIIVSARKGTASPMILAAGLVLHEPDGRFTDAADAVLRGAALSV